MILTQEGVADESEAVPCYAQADLEEVAEEAIRASEEGRWSEAERWEGLQGEGSPSEEGPAEREGKADWGQLPQAMKSSASAREEADAWETPQR